MFDGICVLFILQGYLDPGLARRVADGSVGIHHAVLPLPAGSSLPPKRICALDNRHRVTQHVDHGGNVASLAPQDYRRRSLGATEKGFAHTFKRKTALRECAGLEDSEDNVVHGRIWTCHVSRWILYLVPRQPILPYPEKVAKSCRSTMGGAPRRTRLVVSIFLPISILDYFRN